MRPTMKQIRDWADLKGHTIHSSGSVYILHLQKRDRKVRDALVSDMHCLKLLCSALMDMDGYVWR